MKRISIVAIACMLGCGAAQSGGASSGETPSEREARGRRMDRGSGEASRIEMKRVIDDLVEGYKRETEDVESKLLSAARITLGEEDANGQRQKGSVGATFGRLKSAGVPPRMAGNPNFQSGYLLPDAKSHTAALEKMSRAKRDAVMNDYGDFVAQSTTMTWYAYLASQHQIEMHLQAVHVAAKVVRNQKKYGLAPSDDDILVVQKSLNYVRRADELAAAGAGLSAALIAVTNGGKPPKILDDMAIAVKKAIPSKAEATPAEAKAYVDGFENGLGDARQRYEAMLKSSYGAEWEKSTLKSIVEQVFRDAEGATNQKSEASRREDANKRRVSLDSSAPGGGSNDAVGKVESLAKGLLPSDGPLRKAIGVVDALKNGDAKGAIGGALAFVPDGPIKTGLGIVLSFL